MKKQDYIIHDPSPYLPLVLAVRKLEAEFMKTHGVEANMLFLPYYFHPDTKLAKMGKLNVLYLRGTKEPWVDRNHRRTDK